MHAYSLAFAAAAILAIAFVLFRKKSSATVDVRVSAESANNVIFTTYFCRKLDPIRKVYAPCNDFSYIAPWYTSMQELGLYGVIFHDGMSDEFINQYQTAKIRFEFVDPVEFIFSLNDYRYFIYLKFLEANANYEQVFMTDGNDVKVVRNPFENLRQDRIYVGSETGNFKTNKWIQRRVWLLNSGSKTYRFKLPWRRTNIIYNAGILGGSRQQCLEFLRKMVATLQSLDPEQRNLNLNMAVLNFTVYEYFRKIVVTGEPLHSVFKEYQNARQDVWFIHK